jgi:hypothetical protein
VHVLVWPMNSRSRHELRVQVESFQDNLSVQGRLSAAAAKGIELEECALARLTNAKPKLAPTLHMQMRPHAESLLA